MRLLELEIENFGVFAGERFEFGPGFQLICGPNEAGKSTLLQLVREVFFGFPLRSPYLFAGRSGEMAAIARIGLSDGRRVKFRRRKGTKGVVVGNFVEGDEDGDAVDEATLTGLLGNANADLYANVFGFSLAELAAGEQSLKQTDLTEALYGGGLGGLANFQRVRADIRTEHEGLFTPGASKRDINRLLAVIKERRRAVADTTVKPRDYQKVRDEAEQLNQEVEEVRGRRETTLRRQSHLKRLSDALPSWLRLQSARDELAQLQAPERFPENGEERFRAARRRRAELAEELEQARNDVADLSERIDTVQLQPQLVAREGDIKRLEQDVGRIRQFAEDIPKRSGESEKIKEAVLRDVKKLNPEWDLSHLDRFQTSQAQRDSIEAMEQELDQIQRQKDKLDARRPDLVDEIERKQSELQKLVAVQSVPDLERLVERAGDYKQDRDAAEGLSEQICTGQEKLDELKKQLEGPIRSTIDDPAALPIPLDATITKHRDKFAESAETLKDATRRLEASEQDVADKQRALAELDAQARIPDRDELLALRRRRDAGWQLVRRKFVDQDPQLSDSQIDDWLGEAGPSLPDQYEREVETADQLADQRQEKAETVARREQLAAQLASLQQRTAELQQRQTRLNEDRQRLESEWRDEWRDCGFAPLTPDEMHDWLRIHEDYREQSREHAQWRSKLDDVRGRVEQFEAALAAAVGGDDSADEQLAEVRRRVEAAQKAAVRREQYEADLPQRKRQLDDLIRQIDELSAKRNDWDGRWRQQLGEFGFPEDWSVGTAMKILGGLAEARTEHSKAKSLDKRVRDMEAEFERYGGEVAPLCQEIAPDLADLPAEEAAVQLAERVEVAKQAGRSRESFTTQCEKAKKLVTTKEQQLQKCEREIGELLEAAGAADEDEFQQAAHQARRHAELTDEVQRLDREVNRIAAEEDAEVFVEELGKAKRDEVDVLRQRAEEESREIEKTYQDRVEKAALARDQLERLDRASEAAELAQELESDRAQLAAAVDRWAPLVLAQTLMAQAIERFEREHQPEMLTEIGRLFSKMTHGRYTGVRRKLDEKGTLLLDLRDGSQKEPHELSTGTREQLYLAMRLAYVCHYCREAEPLPLVMDDVLVNFDDQRARATLDVLLEVAEQMQILFMTCHQSIADMIRAVAPKMKPIELNHRA